MSYQTIKDGIVTRMTGLGFARSKEPFDFDNAPTNKFGKTFILFPEESERSDPNQTLSDRYRDNQTWIIKIAFEKSERNDIIQLDKIGRKREEIIKDLDNPANWQSFALQLFYSNSSVEELEDYFLLTINLIVTDQVTY